MATTLPVGSWAWPALRLNIVDQLVEAHPQHLHVTLDGPACILMIKAAFGEPARALARRPFGQIDHLKRAKERAINENALLEPELAACPLELVPVRLQLRF